jgi:hypothetical protein
MADGANDALTLNGLAAGLKGCSGVTEATVHPVTGSIVLRFEGDLGAIAEQAEASQICRFSDETLARAHGSFAMPRMETLAALALLGLAGVQALRGRMLPPTATLLWYAASLAGLLDGEGRNRPPGPRP